MAGTKPRIKREPVLVSDYKRSTPAFNKPREVRPYAPNGYTLGRLHERSVSRLIKTLSQFKIVHTRGSNIMAFKILVNI